MFHERTHFQFVAFKMIFFQKKEDNDLMGNQVWCVCLLGAVLLQFEDMDCLSVAGGAEELGVCAEGQRTDADVSDHRQTSGK